MEAGPAPWWLIVSTLVTAGATLALAWFAWVELRALGEARRDAQRLAAARISTAGVLLRRQVRSWLGPDSGSPDGLGKWVAKVGKVNMYGEHLDRAEARIVDMLEAARNAPNALAHDVEEAAALFLNGTEWLNEFVATPQPSGNAVADWVNLRDRAWHDLADCVALLDQRIASGSLLNAARRRAAQTRTALPGAEEYRQRSAGMLDYLDRKRSD